LREPFKIAGKELLPGQRDFFEIEVASLFDYTQVSIPLEVVHGKEEGPTLFISAAIHGDEINGVEIIKRLRRHKALKRIKGTLIFAPIVNVFGFNAKSRYLPDRRDLNRSFPGTMKGSLAARIAQIFMDEVVRKSDYGIDLHTGALNRMNYPQIRADVNDPETKELVNAFGATVNINSRLRDGSLREAARKEGVRILLFEGGEALRFDELSIRQGLHGCLGVLEKVGMIAPIKRKKTTKTPKKNKNVFYAETSHWVRAPRSGSFVTKRKLGEILKPGDLLATVSDPFGLNEEDLFAKNEGLIIGMSSMPLVNRGDAIFHIAYFQDFEEVEDAFDLDVVEDSNLPESEE